MQASIPDSVAQSTVTAIAGGGENWSLVLLANNTLAAFGASSVGQTSIPAAATSQTISAIAAGYSFGMVLWANGSVYVWGNTAMVSHSRSDTPVALQRQALQVLPT